MLAFPSILFFPFFFLPLPPKGKGEGEEQEVKQTAKKRKHVSRISLNVKRNEKFSLSSTHSLFLFFFPGFSLFLFSLSTIHLQYTPLTLPAPITCLCASGTIPPSTVVMVAPPHSLFIYIIFILFHLYSFVFFLEIEKQNSMQLGESLT